jgi:hypothetical protein
MRKESSINGVETVIPGQHYAMPGFGIMASMPANKKQQPTAVVEKGVIGTSGLMPWGDNNAFPNTWEQDIEANTTLRDAIEKEVDRIYAGGLEYGYEENINGLKTFKYHAIPALDDIIESPMGMFAFEQIISDYVKHRLPFPELIFSADKKQVIGLNALPAAHTRWAVQSPNGYILKAFFSRNMPEVANENQDSVITTYVLDPIIDSHEALKKELGTLRYTYRIPLAGWRTYYPLTPAYSSKTSGWLPISNMVTETYSYLLKNQMNPKYHLEMDVDHLKNKYKERWSKADAAEINSILTEELKHFHDMLHGTKNSGNNILTLKEISKILQKEYSSWTITELKGSVFDKGYLELSNLADKHIQKSVGLDPSVSESGSGMGGGSGSDKREAFNIRMATAQRHVNHILSPYNWLAKYNGYKGPAGEKIIFRMVTPYLQTLNNVTPDTRGTKLTTAE